MSERKEFPPESKKRLQRLLPSALAAASLLVPAVNALTQAQVDQMSRDAHKSSSAPIVSDVSDTAQWAVEKKPGGGGGWGRVWSKVTWYRFA